MDFFIDNEELYINNRKLILDSQNIICELGRGANAKVFLSYNKLLNRKEALKIWMPRKNQENVDIKRYLFEIRKNAKFSNSNIAQIYSANIIDNYYCVFMEYCPGITLKEDLRNNKNYFRRVYILNLIAATMHEVYKNGLYHGDLHSKNIIINNNDIKILDFGTSVFMQDKSISNMRDAHMLFDLAMEILPELKEFSFFNSHVRESSSIEICECILYLINLLIYEINDSGDAPPDFYLMELALITKEVPVLNLDDVILYTGNNNLYIKYYNAIDNKNIEDINKIIHDNDYFFKRRLLFESQLDVHKERHAYI